MFTKKQMEKIAVNNPTYEAQRKMYEDGVSRLVAINDDAVRDMDAWYTLNDHRRADPDYSVRHMAVRKAARDKASRRHGGVADQYNREVVARFGENAIMWNDMAALVNPGED